MSDTTQQDQPRDGNGKFVYTVEGAQRDADAARLRARGMTYRQIAAELGVDTHTAHDAVRRALAAIVAEPAADAQALELERLDALYARALAVMEAHHVTVSNGKVIRLVEDGDPLEDDGPVLAAIDRLVRISESRRKLLGLDSPVKMAVSGGVRYELVGVDPEVLR